MDIGSPTNNDETKQADSKAAIGPASISKLELAEIGFLPKRTDERAGLSHQRVHPSRKPEVGIALAQSHWQPDQRD